MLGLTTNESAEGQSILSISGIQKLDQQLNLIKTKALEIIRRILEYVFNRLSNEQREFVPFIRKMEGVAPLLIKTAYCFATHPELSTLLFEDVATELIV